jgi:hypothetical protein
VPQAAIDRDMLCTAIATALGRPDDPTVTGWSEDEGAEMLLIRIDGAYADCGLRVLSGLQARLKLDPDQVQVLWSTLYSTHLMLERVETQLAQAGQPPVEKLDQVKTMVSQTIGMFVQLVDHQKVGA